MSSVNCQSKNVPNVAGGASLNAFSSRSREHGLSVFHCDLPSGAYMQTDDCLTAVHQCIKAMNGWCEAGTRTVATFLKLLKGTVYEQIAGQLQAAMLQVQELAGMEMMKLQRSFQANWCHLSRFSDAANLQTDPAKDSQIVVKELINFVGGFCQLFLFMSQYLSPFVSSRNNVFNCRTSASDALAPISSLEQKPIQPPVGSRPVVSSNRATKVVGGSSPAGLCKQVTSFLSKFGHNKSPDTSCFYVPLESEGGAPLTASNVPSAQLGSQNSANENADGKSNGHVATQEDLDLVISMLSQRSRMPAAGMQAIPEHPLVAGQPDAVGQLAPASSSQPLVGAGLGPSVAGSMQPIGSELSKDQPCNPKISLAGDARGGLNEASETAETLAKMNTWPFKINQKPFWPSWGDCRMMPNVFGMTDYNTLVKNDRPAGQPHHLGTWPAKETYDQSTATLMPGGWYGGGPWPMATASDVNGSWPSQYSTWNTDCMTSLSKSISTAVESSSGSEESNSGDQQWLAGGGGQLLRRRRHSSGEHSLLTQHATISDPLPGINVSLHGHNNDKQLLWTDHQLQGIDKVAAVDDRVRTEHRALSMQWSDPLTNQPLSYWDLDGLSMTKSQSSTASSDNFSKPSASGGHLNKLF